MNTTTLIVIIVLALVAVAIAAWVIMRNRRSGQLREQFGPEYKHAMDQYKDRGRAEAELSEREKRVESLHIHPLSAEERGRFAQAWKSVQARFVDEPSRAVQDAARLVNEVMQARGYPVGDFEQRAADISVDHPNVVTNYRAARATAQANERGEASTEDLRKAMVHYRALFEDLLETRQPEPEPEHAHAHKEAVK